MRVLNNKAVRGNNMKENLMKRVTQTEGCWFWEGKKTYNGYGFFNYRLKGKVVGGMAHRMVYELCVGKIPDGLTLDHLCRVRECVNPDHLDPCTIGENIRRGSRPQSDVCKYGHKYREQSAFFKKIGTRRCHECHAARELKRRAGVLSLLKT